MLKAPTSFPHKSGAWNLNMAFNGAAHFPAQQSSEDETYHFAWQLITASVPFMMLKAAIELNLLEIISKAGPGGHVSPSEIVSHIETDNPEATDMVDRILFLLASYSIVTCLTETFPDGSTARRYGLGPVSKYLINNEDGASLAALCMTDKTFMECWYFVKDAVIKGGTPFQLAHGTSSFDFQKKDAKLNKLYNMAMQHNSTIIMKELLKKYDGFEGIKTLVDVGGGMGVSLLMILSKYPNIKGVNLDLAQVIAHAPQYPGMELVSGDMFESVPKGDAVFIKGILHNWSDEHCVKMLRNCYDALPAKGKAIIVERMMPNEPDSTLATKMVTHMDAIMLAQYVGGKERNEYEFRELGRKAGFRGFQIACCAIGFYAIELLKES